MAKLMQPGEAVRFEPPGQDSTPEGERIAYWLRAPTVVDEAAWRRACTAAGVVAYSRVDLLRAIVKGVADLLPGDENAAERAAVLAEIRAHLDEMQALAQEGADLPDHDDAGRAEWSRRFMDAMANPRVAEIEQIIIRHHQPYRDMLAAADVSPILAGIEAAKLALVRWEGLEGAPRRGLKGLDEATLQAIPREHYAPMGEFFAGLCGPARAERKNSAPPSGGAADTTASEAANTQPPMTP